jgi:hypothetical protein
MPGRGEGPADGDVLRQKPLEPDEVRSNMLSVILRRELLRASKDGWPVCRPSRAVLRTAASG